GALLKPIPGGPYFSLDGKFLQTINAETKEFLKGSRDKRLDDKDILAAHMKWESDYISETLGAKLKIESNYVKLSNGTTALEWAYDMPTVSAAQTAKRQLYLIIVNGNGVFGLNTAVEQVGEEKSRRQFLLDSMNTFKPRETPLNLDKAREESMKKQTALR